MWNLSSIKLIRHFNLGSRAFVNSGRPKLTNFIIRFWPCGACWISPAGPGVDKLWRAPRGGHEQVEWPRRFGPSIRLLLSESAADRRLGLRLAASARRQSVGQERGPNGRVSSQAADSVQQDNTNGIQTVSATYHGSYWRRRRCALQPEIACQCRVGVTRSVSVNIYPMARRRRGQ
jgi:hypothetical protein